ncbi:MAG: hypothetical protein OEY28_14540, partial [Nitrospira sp.]|nr:hypothetical protein [Nitrospira sp.]
THSTSNYRDDLYAFLSNDQIEKFKQDPYFDSKGLVSIGVGFNIETDRTVRLYVLNQLGVFAGQSAQEIRNRSSVFDQLIGGVTDGDEVALVNQLNAKLREYLGFQTSMLFMLGENQSRAIFEQILGDPVTGKTTIPTSTQSITQVGKQWELDEKLRNAGVTIDHNTKEYVALMSLYYNQDPGNPLIGRNLLNALAQGERVEAWYEIRYQSNGGGSKKGVAHRRYLESDLFGLYNGANGQFPVSEQEARQVLAYLHQPNIEEQILRYERNHRLPPVPKDNFDPPNGLNRYTDPAEGFLVTAFAGPLGESPRYAYAANPNGPSGDPLTGSDENDLLLGGTSHDIVIGGAGDDLLIGGAGAGKHWLSEKASDVVLVGSGMRNGRWV